MVQNDTFSRDILGKMPPKGLQNCPRAALEAREGHLLLEVEGKNGILTLLTGQSVLLFLKNQFSCLPGGILYIMPWHPGKDAALSEGTKILRPVNNVLYVI